MTHDNNETNPDYEVSDDITDEEVAVLRLFAETLLRTNPSGTEAVIPERDLLEAIGSTDPSAIDPFFDGFSQKRMYVRRGGIISRRPYLESVVHDYDRQKTHLTVNHLMLPNILDAYRDSGNE
ncbi:hypothetical protein [Salimicrobium halophilum]|uniref:Uncharacterized protein n=1 Tax=Salimicrobium halophilum TaxID=86666 RepID=A0A1G8W915_9BACI|nr:hypothetical protein [Salimicrobium halophilum]SDJ74215.1 hypothetical protein SAMN04490247_3069 [Salimicrobium halophilum]